MFDAIWLSVGAILRLIRTRRRLLLENLALRQQLAVLKRKHARPRLAALDKLFWVLVRRFWSEWKQALIIVGPETVVRYYHEDRTHLGLRKETPAGRVRSTDRGTVVSQARLGGLHHRYDRAA
jgi:hypothetical protein